MAPAVYPITLSYTSFVIGIVSFVFLLLNLIALYADAVATIRAAPEEIRDALGNLREQICEERAAVRQQIREARVKNRASRAASTYYPPSYNLHHHQQPRRHHRHRHRRSRSRRGRSDDRDRDRDRDDIVAHDPTLALGYSVEALSLHYATLRDLWRKFKALERPFLVSSRTRAEAIRHGDAWGDDDLADGKVRRDVEAHGEAGSYADWSALYHCDPVHRFIWWQSKRDVMNLAELVGRLTIRRMGREMTVTRMAMREILEHREWDEQG